MADTSIMRLPAKTLLRAGPAALVLLSLLAIAVTVEGQARTASPTGLFGRLQYNRESGDVGGLEVFVVYGRSGYVAVIQSAEGVPEDPVVVPVVMNRTRTALTFEWPMRNGRTLKYQGSIRPDGLYGRFENGEFSDRDDGYFLLRRGRSYWQ